MGRRPETRICGDLHIWATSQLCHKRISGSPYRILAIDNESRTPTYIRMLISNPALLKRLASTAEQPGDIWGRKVMVRNGQPWIWGRDEDLLSLANEAQKSIDRLTHFIKSLSLDQRRRINVRLSHTLMPFGATVRDADKPWGKMVVRMLPVGAIGDIPNPVIKLHRRRDKALFDHYLIHLRYLLANGASVLFGDWDRGDSDLHIEGLQAPNPSQLAVS